MHWLGYDIWNRSSAHARGKPAAPVADSTCDGDDDAYNRHIESIRESEFPMIKDSIYLDHAGTTLYSKSLIDQVSANLMGNLSGNPHSGSASSQYSTAAVEDVRLAVLDFINADPNDFDVVFVANATAGVKLVVESIANYQHKDERGRESRGFWYGYHQDSHTSLVGVREAAKYGSKCFRSDRDVDDWLSHPAADEKMTKECTGMKLFSYPAQSNMSGRRLPLRWAGEIRQRCSDTYTLLDAAACASTGVLDFRDSENAPDFTVLSFYKIFGYPDLGALIVRRDSAHLLSQRSYFGGGTVDMVLLGSKEGEESAHAMKDGIHERLEDGTLPFHSIMALGAAMKVHKKLFHSQERVSRHATYLTKRLRDALASLKHFNSSPVCHIYSDSPSSQSQTQGPIVAFNLLSGTGSYIPLAELQKLCNIRNIHLRTGSVCNPGGTASALGLANWEIRRNFSAGATKCEAADDLVFGKPTGIARCSLGAMSTVSDVDRFVNFIKEFYIEACPPPSPLSTNLPQSLSCSLSSCQPKAASAANTTSFSVSKLTIYPIKSCAGWDIPDSQPWDFHPAGLAFDREWCLVHRGTNNALSMKKHAMMALIKPSIDLEKGLMIVTVADALLPRFEKEDSTITINLSSLDPLLSEDPASDSHGRQSTVCSDKVTLQVYESEKISRFFSTALRIDCSLARFPVHSSSRHSKLDLPTQSSSSTSIGGTNSHHPHPLALANESPCLIITTSSLSRLPEGTHPSVFRANMILAPVEDESQSQSWPESDPDSDLDSLSSSSPPSLPSSTLSSSSPRSSSTSLSSSSSLSSTQPTLTPYLEDTFTSITFPNLKLSILGKCRRCQMVCIDPFTGQKKEEPFITLWRTRKESGKVWFGVHSGLGSGEERGVVRVGDKGLGFL